MSSSAVALLNPLILDAIFSECKREDNARFSYVCSAWMSVASNYVWRRNPPLSALFGLLGPLVPVECEKNHHEVDPLEFSEPIKYERWERFAFYATKVQRLLVSWASSSKYSLPDESAFVDVAVGRPMAELFPNVEVLNVILLPTRLIGLCTLLFNKKLIEAMFYFDPCVDLRPIMEYVIQELSFRSPSLQTLGIEHGKGFDRPISVSCTAICRLRNLERLALPADVITGDTFSLLAAHTNLKIVYLTCLRSVPNVEIMTLDKRTLPDNMFPSVHTLAIGCDSFGFRSLFFSGSFSKLVTLVIKMPHDDLRGNLHYFLEILSRTCQDLRHLDVSNSFSVDSRSGYVPARDLWPLTSFPVLLDIKLRLGVPINISDDELVELIVACRNLRQVDLGSTNIASKPTLTIGCLQLLASRRESERLESLEIRVDATRVDEHLSNPKPLINLESIFFGTSPVVVSSELIRYLTKVLPRSCTVVTSTFPEPPPGFSDQIRDDFSQIDGFFAPWREVARLVHLNQRPD